MTTSVYHSSAILDKEYSFAKDALFIAHAPKGSNIERTISLYINNIILQILQESNLEDYYNLISLTTCMDRKHYCGVHTFIFCPNENEIWENNPNLGEFRTQFEDIFPYGSDEESNIIIDNTGIVTITKSFY